MIEISEKRYVELLRKEYIYDCLEYAGVDNWQGYDYAMNENLYEGFCGTFPTANEIKEMSDDKIIELLDDKIY